MPMIQSPYRRGADDGFFFGAYLTVMFFASIFSEWMPLLQLLSGAMAVCVPLTIYRFMLRYHRSLGQMGSFPYAVDAGGGDILLRDASRGDGPRGVHEMAVA